VNVQLAEEGLAQRIVMRAGLTLLAAREAEAEQGGKEERRSG